MALRIFIAVILSGLPIASCAPRPAPSRLETIQQRGSLGCGVEPAVPGFSQVDAAGRYRGLDVDVCRAVAAAIFGSAEKVTFVQASSVAEFRRSAAIDVVSRRITWELRREHPYGLLFGPIVFYDGQGFLVARSLGVKAPRELSGRDVCVAQGTVFEQNLDAFLGREALTIRKIPIGDPHDLGAIADAIATGRCRAYSSDLSLLGAIRSRLDHPADFDLLDPSISREPIAPLVRDDDPQFFDILRWTVFALVNAEELGISAANVDQMRASADSDVQRLLGVSAGNGKALGLNEDWAYQAIKGLGNYGEVFERNVGRDSPLGLSRGLNRLAKDGGLMYAPPLR